MIGVGGGDVALCQFRLLGEVAAAQLGGAAGQAGTRDAALGLLAVTRDRTGQLRTLRALRQVGPQLGLLGALQQRLELLALDRLALEQQLGDRLQRVAMRPQDVLRDLVSALDDAADLVIDLAGDLVAVVRLGTELAAEERLPVIVAEDARAELLAHAEA